MDTHSLCTRTKSKRARTYSWYEGAQQDQNSAKCAVIFRITTTLGLEHRWNAHNYHAKRAHCHSSPMISCLVPLEEDDWQHTRKATATLNWKQDNAKSVIKNENQTEVIARQRFMHACGASPAQASTRTRLRKPTQLQNAHGYTHSHNRSSKELIHWTCGVK